MLSIQDEAGNLLPPGQNGEVCARGGNYMIEYWNKKDATEEAFRGGWYHTGDAGYLDEDGYLYLVDRVKDMIVTGGENVYSIEVENAISTHPAVAQVAVIGIPERGLGRGGARGRRAARRRRGDRRTRSSPTAASSIANYKTPEVGRASAATRCRSRAR